jgi:Protein of unknown function (DUF4235)
MISSTHRKGQPMAGKRDGGVRFAALVATFVAGSIARKMITFGWKQFTGNEPPTDPHDPDIALKEALAWSILMGVGMEAARLLAARLVAARVTRIAAAQKPAD